MSPQLPAPRPPVHVLDPLGPGFRRPFETFLACTDQKTVAEDYLGTLAAGLAQRRVFVDAGAGEGGTTARLAALFERTVAVEPNRHLHEALRLACPEVEVRPEEIGQAQVSLRADLVLCAHVLYYLPRADWAQAVRRMLGWLAEGGELVVVLQNPGSDCLRMVRQLTGARYDLGALCAAIRQDCAELGAVISLDTRPSMVRTESEEDAVTVAQFMLNLAPRGSFVSAPDREEVRSYVRGAFADPAGGFSFSCSQDFLRVRLPGSVGGEELQDARGGGLFGLLGDRDVPVLRAR